MSGDEFLNQLVSLFTVSSVKHVYEEIANGYPSTMFRPIFCFKP